MTEPMGSTGANRAVVVGGSTGIGKGLALGLAEAGYTVHVVSRQPPTGHDTDALTWHECDLADPVRTRLVLSQLAEEPIGVLCFSAAYYGTSRHALTETPEDQWRHQVDVMLHGLWLTLKLCLPAVLRAESGLVIGVSSEVVFNGGPGRSGYAAVKSAASSLLRSVGQEYANEGLCLVEVLPQGMVDSPGIRHRRPADFDFSEYMSAADFQAIGAELGRTRGKGLNGVSLAVLSDGSWTAAVGDDIPRSQSRGR